MLRDLSVVNSLKAQAEEMFNLAQVMPAHCESRRTVIRWAEICIRAYAELKEYHDKEDDGR